MPTVRELAVLVGGDVCGDADVDVAAACPLHEATERDITFAVSERHAAALAVSRAAAAVVLPGMAAAGKALIRVDDPLSAFVAIAAHFQGHREAPPPGIDLLASVDSTAQVGPGATIHAFATVGPGAVIGARCRVMSGAVIGADCRLGDDVTLHPNAVLYDRTVLGNRVIVHANATIGADGFGYRFRNGRHDKTPQLGCVEVGDDVEVGAGTTIDRGTFGATRIGAGTKIDNLVMIAHNCQIGRHNILCSQVGLAGSSSTGEYVIIAGQAGIVDHVHIGDGAMIGGQTGITKDVPAGQRMFGTPAAQEVHQKRIMMSLLALPDLRKTVRRIVKHLGLKVDGAADRDAA